MQPSSSAAGGYLYLFIFPLLPGEHLSRMVRLFLAVLRAKNFRDRVKQSNTAGFSGLEYTNQMVVALLQPRRKEMRGSGLIL